MSAIKVRITGKPPLPEPVGSGDLDSSACEGDPCGCYGLPLRLHQRAGTQPVKPPLDGVPLLCPGGLDAGEIRTSRLDAATERW